MCWNDPIGQSALSAECTQVPKIRRALRAECSQSAQCTVLSAISVHSLARVSLFNAAVINDKVVKSRHMALRLIAVHENLFQQSVKQSTYKYWVRFD